jgi:hypothetical protein
MPPKGWQKGRVTAMEKKEHLMTQRKQANTLIICDMIRMQIHLKSVLSGLKPSSKRRLRRVGGVRTGIEPARFQLDNQKSLQ